MKPLNTGSPKREPPEEKAPIPTEPRREDGGDYFDPSTGTAVGRGPSHPAHEAERPVEEDLPQT